MTGRDLPPGVYGYDAVTAGDRVVTGTARVTTHAIDAFAALTGDRFPLHMSEEAARDAGFGGRVAHGLLVLSMIDGLKNQAAAQFRAHASLGWTIRFSAPVLAGDTISATLTVQSKRITRDPERGILTLRVEALNRHGETVQSGENHLMVLR